jgi:hypothetical protein
MYREYVISTNPYSYWPLDEIHGDVDVMGRSGDLTGADVPVATGTAPKLYQPLVPGFHSSKSSGATSTLGLNFATEGKEPLPFTVDGWFELHTNNDNDDHGTVDILSIGTNVVGADTESLYVYLPGIMSHHFKVPDMDQAFYFAMTWTGSTLSVYVNGFQFFSEEAPTSAAFSNTDPDLVLDATFASNVCVYDRALQPEEIAAKFLSAQSISHTDACANDEGQVFKMRAERNCFFDLELDQEFNSDTSKNLFVDPDGYFATKPAPDLAYDSAPNFPGTGVEIGAGEYLYAPAKSLLGLSQFVICIMTDDDNTRASDEYLFSLIGSTQRVSAYVTSANDFKIDVVDVADDGTETPTTITFDDTVSTSGGAFILVYNNGFISLKSDGTPLDLNPVSSATEVEQNIVVDDSTFIVLGTDGEYGGAAIPLISTLVTYDTVLSLDDIDNDYANYFAATRATGYWPMNTGYEIAGFTGTSLHTEILLPSDEEILCAYAITDGGQGMRPEITTSDSTDYIDKYIKPVLPIPFNSTPGVDIDQSIEVEINSGISASAVPDKTSYPATSGVVIRSFIDRYVKAENSEARINFTGNGHLWINSEASNRFARNKYDGVFFDSGSVIGEIEDVNIDGVTTHYEYRAFEFLLYIDYDTVNSGRIISIYDGSTERYVSVNKAGNALSHNMASLRVNDINMSGKNITNLYNQWIHVYCELTSLVSDQQVYVGAGYNSTNFVNGVGLQNLALYDEPLGAANITEHYQAFLGRYTFRPDDSDALSVSQVAAPSLYSPAWHTNVIPV